MKPTKRIIGVYGGGKRGVVSIQLRRRRVNLPGVAFGQLAVVRLAGYTDLEPAYSITHIASGRRIGRLYNTKLVAVDIAQSIAGMMDYDAHWERTKNIGNPPPTVETIAVKHLTFALHAVWEERVADFARYRS